MSQPSPPEFSQFWFVLATATWEPFNAAEQAAALLNLDCRRPSETVRSGIVRGYTGRGSSPLLRFRGVLAAIDRLADGGLR
jgi:hypothetical protein